MKKRVSIVLSIVFCLMLMTAAAPANADSGISYIGEVGKETVYTGDYTEVSASTVNWGVNDGAEHWYVVDSDVTVSSRITVAGDVRLILTDGYSLYANEGIAVNSAGASLTIYAQSTDESSMGALIANGESGSGIGGDYDSFQGSITINGGKVTATGDSGCAGIGGIAQNYGVNTPHDSAITINGGIVEATGGSWAPGIGIGGYCGSSVVITINGGKVTSIGGDSGGAGIGSRENSSNYVEININGGNINATGRDGGAGIGCGAMLNEGKVTITGGVIVATGGSNSAGGGAGIGGGRAGEGQGVDITITGGLITATGGGDAAGIGAGTDENGTFSATGNITVNTGEAIYTNSIGGDKSSWNGVIFEGTAGQVYGSVELGDDLTIQTGHTLTIPSGSSLTIPEGTTLTNNSTITNNGFIANYGSTTGSGEIINNSNVVNSGNIDCKVTGTVSTLEKNDNTVTISSGESTVTVTLTDANDDVTPNPDGTFSIPGGSSVQIGSAPVVTLPADGGTLYPDGTLVYSVTVTFDSCGGNEAASQTVTVNQPVTEPAAPTRSGYYFRGWYTAKSGGEKWDFSSPVKANMTLYAHWGAINFPDPTYAPIVSAADNGTVSVSPERAEQGESVVITAQPDKGYMVGSITVLDKNSVELNVTHGPNSTYSFVQPEGAVRVYVTFVPVVAAFDDVSSDAWYFDAVNYVVANGLMEGMSDTSFAPDANMSRAMVWAILARISGETVTGTGWADTARAWAVANGVSDGENANGRVTREQLATMLYRFAGEPEASGDLSAFTDAGSVSEYAAKAMAWAVENGIITGVTDTVLSPQGTAARAQCAAMLMRFIEK